MTSDQLETLAQTLTATGDYRIIRRLKPRPRTIPPPGTPVRLGLLVDVETTGLDPQRDEIIELAMTPFTYGLDGTVFSVEEGFQGLRHSVRPETRSIRLPPFRVPPDTPPRASLLDGQNRLPCYR